MVGQHDNIIPLIAIGFIIVLSSFNQQSASVIGFTIHHIPSVSPRYIKEDIKTTTILYSSTKERKKRGPSKVVDEDGPTPEFARNEIGTIALDEIPELREITDPSDLPNPIPYQPWRRGDTAGCEDPITADWRVTAEEIIYKAATLVGGSVLDVTWYLTSVLITIDDEQLPPVDYLKSSGPVVEIIEPMNPLYYDPNDPEPEEIWDDEDEIVYVHETDEEAEAAALKKKKMYAPIDKDLDPPDEPEIPGQTGVGDTIPLYRNEETRADIAFKSTEDEQTRYDESEQPIVHFETSIHVNTAAISTLSKAIMDALEQQEENLCVLARHEVLLAGPCQGSPDIIETQKQFNAYRNQFIIVQTIDPFGSNRILKGKLIDRNAMDLLINKKGRLVTIPLNFVQCVRLANMDVAVGGSKNNNNNLYTSIDENDDEEEEEFVDEDE